MKRCLKPTGAAVVATLAFLAMSAAAQAAQNVQYNGGPVSHSISGVVVDWGPHINSVYTDSTNGDPGLIKYFAANSGSTGDIGGVLAQYMDGTGHNAANLDSYGGQFQITPSVTATTISDSQIQSELVSQIQGGHLPRPTGDGLSTIYLVLFPPGDTECIDSQTCSGSYFCAYHSNTALSDGTNVLYAVLPDNTQGPMTQGCGNASTLFQDQTAYLSHEWSETITDPLGTAWWDSSPGGSGNEIGDWCNQDMGQNGSWEVQYEWSNLDNNCVPSESAYSAPTASFLAPSTAAAAQSLGFDASSSSDPSHDTASAVWSGHTDSISSGITSYLWNWGDGSANTTGSTATAAHTFASAGTYQVSLTVTDNLGFTSTVTKQVTVGSGTLTPPTVTTSAAGNVTSQGATLNGQVNPEGQTVSYQFDYGTSPTSLTHSTTLVSGLTGQSASAVTATLSTLTPSTTYYDQLVVTAGGQSYSGAVGSFSTPASTTGGGTGGSTGGGTGGSTGGGTGGSTGGGGTPPPAPAAPAVRTGGASLITSSSATVSGAVNPAGSATTYLVEFGTTKAYGHSTPATSAGSGTSSVSVRVPLTGLAPRTRYHYRLVATSAGGTMVGADGTFTTVRAPKSAPRLHLHAPAHISSHSFRTRRLRVHFSCSAACQVHFILTTSMTHILHTGSVPLTLASGLGKLRAGGSGTTTLAVIAGAPDRLLNRRLGLRLVVSATAVGPGTSPSVPQAQTITVG